MMSRIDRIRRTVSARRAARAEADRLDEVESAAPTNLPVPVGPAVTVQRSFRDDRGSGDSELNAQILGQDGQRRGLRAGPSIFDIARAAYTRIEWSGAYDRRARKGRQARTEV
ncbi:hypothetical protein [Phenylobacterium sp.]|uniref:hypothetical protein n=1 Tax=Phenylobacterium sp. TaxID=1871053 RepID=UPI0025DD2AB5|nr:hypothetical protein [Phenylobacterium sp.]